MQPQSIMQSTFCKLLHFMNKPTHSISKEKTYLLGTSTQNLGIVNRFFFLMNPNVLVKIKFSSVKLSAC